VADVAPPVVEIAREPEPEPVHAPEPEPESVMATEPLIDPNEITAPPPAPKRGWWRGRG
jgi:ribonuclease E